MAFRINGVDVKVSDSEKLNGATESATATANTIAKRDASGRIKAAAAVASDDVVIKSQLDAAASGGAHGIQLFTASGTFTVPAGVTSLKVSVLGAGGGGGTTTADRRWSTGGGAGGGAIKFVAVTPGQQIAVTIGAGAYNTAGGTTSFGAFVSATGGALAGNYAYSDYATRTTAGGVGVGGDLNFTGASAVGSHFVRSDKVTSVSRLLTSGVGFFNTTINGRQFELFTSGDPALTGIGQERAMLFGVLPSLTYRVYTAGGFSGNLGDARGYPAYFGAGGTPFVDGSRRDTFYGGAGGSGACIVEW
jgi:hypothetical protein